MEWEQLEYFQTLARMQHVTKAAKSLSITQPALSRSIARLENHLGVPLFDRQGRSISLNQYGHIFLRRVQAMMKEYTEGKEEIQALLKPDQGVVSLGFLHTLGTTLVPDLIGSFQQEYSNISFQLKQNHSYWLLERLKSGDLDLCLLASIKPEDPIQWIKLWSEELFVFVPNDHPLASRESITLNEIAGERFILLKKGYALRMTVDELFEKANIQPNIMFEGEEAATAAGFVAAGLGISILPDLKGLDQSKITKIRVSWPECQRVIGIAWIKGRFLSPVAETFKQYVISHFSE
ncbi:MULTISPECIES: LysR family transcriptional regulator [Bacillus]|uniref:LysR family transcriptional regulator n=1 Tax=Bacillus TaxID=1386 RepID=UPI0013642E5D|nr:MULTISPECIES: LysR family transcriptional regulator [Bacillus]MBU8844002.1 LysR family transcriptional regulator [Alkalicoccobacillus gibsonii]MBO3636653.1 LysR family transcriptional regulator [Bacillus subtilis]MBU8676222.1 LysR family transcriptional regulator [Bacillus subtilis]MBU8804388.1 LysR family transcriptional regulator [Bacillus subtilis]MDI6564267.1 LysR family transcriptional regulator [Bacillus subtilis]